MCEYGSPVRAFDPLLRQYALGQASLQLLNHLARLLPQLLVRIVLSLNDSALKGVDLARKERSAGTMASF